MAILTSENDNCPLCLSNESRAFLCQRNVSYFECKVCSLIYQNKIHTLSPLEENNIYLQHENSPDQKGYIDFLKQASDPLLKLLKPNSLGLDFGCGTNPATPKIFSHSGHKLEIYDPYYFPTLPQKTFDFLISTEVVEHFNHPRSSWLEMDKFVEQGSYISIMTSLYTNVEHFKTWHYQVDPTHVSFYHEESIEYICDLIGWELLDTMDRKVMIFQKK